ncbi:hypothetical protein [Metabacillus bambusae]|uniref:Rod shape-determining protein MreD n=1 Tax=Metabacillus bambusae TaxID=2795218 RepID=A0ABS3NAM3_9BACI|nr:hypothetical protein [Metabacillus bambusae]MBO1515034.1 hypothetical protein [Metabacillus bambusae]
MVYIFTISSLVINILIILLVPIKLTRQDIYITWMFVTLNVLAADLFFGDVFDLYDLIDPGPQTYDLFVQMTLPATFGILYLNFMPKNKKSFIYYLLFWVIFSSLYELLSSYFGYVVYKGWKLWWTPIYFLITCLITRWHFYFARNKNTGH